MINTTSRKEKNKSYHKRGEARKFIKMRIASCNEDYWTKEEIMWCEQRTFHRQGLMTCSLRHYNGRRSIRFARGCVNDSGKNSASLLYSSVRKLCTSRAFVHCCVVTPVVSSFRIVLEWEASSSELFCFRNKIDVKSWNYEGKTVISKMILCLAISIITMINIKINKWRLQSKSHYKCFKAFGWQLEKRIL